jgi:nitroreductase
MDVFEAVRTLLAVRDYDSRPVPDDVVRKILEAGRLSASAMNRQPWHFVVVQDKDTITQIAKAATTGPYIAGAPLVIAVAINSDRWSESDATRAIHSMLLTAWGEGVGSNWVASGFDDVAKLLGIPDDLHIIALLPLGYPADARRGTKKQRKPLSEIAHREHFTHPFE